MKTRLFILAAVCSLSTSVMGQMKIEQEGKILVGNYGEISIVCPTADSKIM